MRGARTAHALAGAALAVVLAAGGIAGAAAADVAPAGAGTPGTAGPAAAPAQQVAPALRLLAQPTVVRAGEPFDVEVQVQGAPAGARLDIVVHDRLESRRAFRDTLDGDLGDEQQPVVAARPIADWPTGPSGGATVSFVPELASRGVYPVAVRMLSAEGEVLATLGTYLSFLTDETPEFTPLEVAVLVDAAAPPSLQPDGEYALPSGLTERVDDRVELLRRTPGVPLTLAPQPETLAALAVAGPDAAAGVDALRSQTAGRRVLARPFVDVDPAALQRAGLLSEANHQADSGADVVRDRLGVEPVGGVWMSGPTLGAESARLIAELGYQRAVVPPSAVDLGSDDADEPVPPAAPVRLGDDGPTALVTDTLLAEHLADDDGMVSAHRFLAELMIMWLEAPSIPRGVVLHLPADTDIDPDVAAVALGALDDGQALRAVPVEQVFQDVPPLEEGPTSLDPTPRAGGSELGSIAPALRAARDRVAGVGALTDDSDRGAQLDHSLLLATGADTPDGERRAYVDRVADELDVVSGAVTLPDEYRITLTSRTSTIPVTLTNLSEQELTVRVVLESDQLEFPDGNVVTTRLPPASNHRLDVEVRTRTSGAFSLDVRVTSPDGTILLDSSTFDVRSTTISGVGIVLSIGAVLFLAVWWARHWRSSRRSRRLVVTSVGPPPAGAPDGVVAVRGGDPTTRPPPRAGPPPAADDDDYRPAHMARHRPR